MLFTQKPKLSKKGAMIRNYAYGCTMVFNRKLLDLYIMSIEARIWMHDFWAYLIAIFLGNIVYDNESEIMYRQHGDNVIGYQSGLRLYRFKPNHIRKVVSNHPREYMMLDFYDFFSQILSVEDRKMIENFLHYRDGFLLRLKSSIDKEYQVYDGSQNFFLAIKFLLGVV